MSQIPTPPELEGQTARGYSPPVVKQFSVFLNNKVGRLSELVETFTEQPVRLVAFSVVDSADHSVVRLVTTDSDTSRALLRNGGFSFNESEMIVVEFSADQRLSHLCAALLSAEVNIYYAYPLTVRPHGSATMALYTDDQILSGQLLRRRGFTLLGEADLQGDIHGPNRGIKG